MPVGGVTGWLEGSLDVCGIVDDGGGALDVGGMVVAGGNTSGTDVVTALVTGVDAVSSTARGGFVEEVHPENQPSVRRGCCLISLDGAVRRGTADLVRLSMLGRSRSSRNDEYILDSPQLLRHSDFLGLRSCSEASVFGCD